MLTSYRGSETNLVIPEELDGLQVKAISQGFEKNLKIKSIILSKNIAPAKETHRDLEVLNEIETLEEIRVAKDNLSYQAQDGVLYSKDKKQLFSYPKSKKSETYNMPASVKKVEEQAEEYGHSIERELAYMIVHGFYHLMGYDHMNDEDKKAMREKEEKVLESLDIVRE